jgi:hypothetical protein
MPNTYDAALLRDSVSSRVLELLQPKLASLSIFASDFSDAPMDPTTNVIRVPKVTGTGATQVNPTSFEGGTHDVGSIPVTMNRYSHPITLTAAEINSGHKLSTVIKAHMNRFSKTLLNIAMGPVTKANFTAPNQLIQAAFTKADLKTIFAKIAASEDKALLLDGTQYSELIPDSANALPLSAGAYGFTNGIHLNTDWSGAGANTYGFACGMNAIAVASRLPTDAPGLGTLVDQSIVQLPIGMTVQLNIWVSAQTRNLYASLDVVFGSGLGDKTAGVLIASA